VVGAVSLSKNSTFEVSPESFSHLGISLD
jgi:hypothetical protein